MSVQSEDKLMESCLLCGLSDDNPLCYGKMYKSEDISVHHFCLIFSYKLYSKYNKDTENALDLYDIEEIKGYITKYVDQKCAFCDKPFATLKCNKRQCTKYFHYICAFDSEKCTLKFDGLYTAYCPVHTPRNPLKHKDTDKCMICLNDLGERTVCGQINLNCRKYMWIHRICAIRLASNRGYGFQCPICGESKKFQNYIKLRGVFIPDVDILTQIHNQEVQDHQTKYCEAEICLRTSSLERKIPEKLTEEKDREVCTFCGKVFHRDCGFKQGRLNEENCFVCSSCLDLSEHDLSVRSSSPAPSNSALNKSFDLGSDNEAIEEDQESKTEQTPKKFKFDTEYQFFPSNRHRGHDFRLFKLNYFMNSLKTVKK